MNMTHPDILKAERFGSLNANELIHILGECECCGTPVTDECESYRDRDGRAFCSMDCVNTYYGIETVG